MTVLLRVDASSRHDGSSSRQVGDDLVAALKPQRVIVRDLAAAPVPQLSEAAITAFFSPRDTWTSEQQDAQALSEQLLDEIAQADTLLLTVPMYNFGIPAALKAWIDQIMRVGHTFSFDGKSFSGLVRGKRAILVVAYGAEGYVEGDLAGADFVVPYLRFVLNFIGISDVSVIALEGRSTGPSGAAEDMAKAGFEAALVNLELV
ncbi:NAD(P)H-dependent oxidoreductase [Novosphingobium sp.]|uniref:FMN-dependent NADH-azoreductase n=1 Tax=Novosphingobium sp. TaxID=1874826 RepID=UPI0026310B34|nr:NAD(P)H-dependent oxidoreductase [Novosphingobium sp.]